MDKKIDYKITRKIGKAKIQTKDGIFCECGKKLSSLFEKCECNNN